jgi:hypothetical protein
MDLAERIKKGWAKLCEFMRQKTAEAVERCRTIPGRAAHFRDQCDHFCKFEPATWEQLDSKCQSAARRIYEWESGHGTFENLIEEIGRLLSDIRPDVTGDIVAKAGDYRAACCKVVRKFSKGDTLSLCPNRCEGRLTVWEPIP